MKHLFLLPLWSCLLSLTICKNNPSTITNLLNLSETVHFASINFVFPPPVEKTKPSKKRLKRAKKKLLKKNRRQAQKQDRANGLKTGGLILFIVSWIFLIALFLTQFFRLFPAGIFLYLFLVILFLILAILGHVLFGLDKKNKKQKRKGFQIAGITLFLSSWPVVLATLLTAGIMALISSGGMMIPILIIAAVFLILAISGHILYGIYKNANKK